MRLRQNADADFRMVEIFGGAFIRLVYESGYGKRNMGIVVCGETLVEAL